MRIYMYLLVFLVIFTNLVQAEYLDSIPDNFLEIYSTPSTCNESFELNGGQVLIFKVVNRNILGVNYSVSASLSGGFATDGMDTLIFPFKTKIYRHKGVFGNTPIRWKIKTGTSSDACVASLSIWSTTVNEEQLSYCGLSNWIKHPNLKGEGYCHGYGKNLTKKLLEEIKPATHCGGYYKTYGYYDTSDNIVGIKISNGNCAADRKVFRYNPPESITKHCVKYGGTGNYRWMYYHKIQPFGGYGTLGVTCEVKIYSTSNN
ncbi:MAG: hypothetical protein VSS75_003015 [Candidatus Parabeggiatoa sp.]|nr:hypothetical protein [Candidatus Parabeggiatoa sp.]